MNETKQQHKEMYYKNPKVLERMTSYTKFREVALLSKTNSKHNTRYLRVGYSNNWKSIFKAVKFFQKDYSIYFSASYYSYFPFISCGEKRKEQIKQWREKEFESLRGQDFILDLDEKYISKNDPRLIETSKFISFYLSKFNLPHQVRFSGRGLHVGIPYYIFKSLGKSLNPSDEDNLYMFYKDLTVDLSSKLNIDFDTAVCHYGRLFKVPYSLADYGDRTIPVVPILTREYPFSNFEGFLKDVRS